MKKQTQVRRNSTTPTATHQVETPAIVEQSSGLSQRCQSIAPDEASHLWGLIHDLSLEVDAANGLILLLLDSKEPRTSAKDLELTDDAFNWLCCLRSKVHLDEQFDALQDYCQPLVHRIRTNGPTSGQRQLFFRVSDN
jgi:hypothetical protein